MDETTRTVFGPIDLPIPRKIALLQQKLRDETDLLDKFIKVYNIFTIFIGFLTHHFYYYY